MPKHIFEGIALYSIEKNGCLNGIYTNEHKSEDGIIYNEICRKIGWTEETKDVLEGVYDCFFFDYKNERCDAKLEIRRTNRTYKFSWINLKTQKPMFYGTGYRMNEHQLAVHYTD